MAPKKNGQPAKPKKWDKSSKPALDRESTPPPASAEEGTSRKPKKINLEKAVKRRVDFENIDSQIKLLRATDPRAEKYLNSVMADDSPFVEEFYSNSDTFVVSKTFINQQLSKILKLTNSDFLKLFRSVIIYV